MEKYTLLDKTKEIDIEEVREYARARTELNKLRARVEYLDDLVSENLILHDHVWTTQEGETKAIKDIDDDHLKNIVTHLRKQGGFNSGINKEYQQRS